MQKLQVVQNVMHGFKRSHHINIAQLFRDNSMMSVNQICVYHILLEMFNVLNNDSSSDLNEKITSDELQSKYNLRSEVRCDLRVPRKPRRNCEGFSYTGPRVWNILPTEIRNLKRSETFKREVKKFIRSEVPFN